MDTIKILILAGGQSSRMGSPKHLLPVPATERPLYQHLIDVIYAAFPKLQTIYFSVAERSILDDTLQHGCAFSPNGDVGRRIELVRIHDTSTQDIGPAAGLLAAHQHDPDASWLVVACDFPLLDPAALHQLNKAFEAPITCFVNEDGFSEPLLAIWSSGALRELSINVANGRLGPNYTVKQLGGKVITPHQADWILNTNTPEEWERVKLRIIRPQSIHGR